MSNLGIVTFSTSKLEIITNKRRTSTRIQIALMFTSIPTSRGNAHYIPSFCLHILKIKFLVFRQPIIQLNLIIQYVAL